MPEIESAADRPDPKIPASYISCGLATEGLAWAEFAKQVVA